MAKTEKLLVSVKEASELMGVSVAMLYSLVRQKAIPHVRFGDRVLFEPAALISACRVATEREKREN